MDLRQIFVLFVDNTDKTYLVKKKDVTHMIESLIRLHIEPGINPYNGGTTLGIKKISLERPTINSYWWTSADLTTRDPTKMAEIIEFLDHKMIFASKEYMIDFNKQCYQEHLADAYAAGGHEDGVLESESDNNPYRTSVDQREIEQSEIEKEYLKIETESKAYLHPKYKRLIKNMDIRYDTNF